MIRNSKRSIRLLGWRTLRWAIALPALPLVWWACTSHPLVQPTPAPEQETDIYISVSPQRLLDLVFMIDNSPSMAPKQDKLRAQFPKLIEALKDPNDGKLPDLRVAILDSDLGTNGAYASSSCGPKTLPDGTQSNFGDMGRFQMIGAAGCGVTSTDATYLETKGNTGLNFNGDINAVFSCLASKLGTLGCGEEHQLQAFEFAFVVSNLGDVNNNQHKMLRGNAYLGLVFLTDEDDCSAAPNDAMFGPKGELSNESASLRCYTRSHACDGGRNLTTSPPGYPTGAAFATTMDKCTARVGDTCNGEDVSQGTSCNPLRDYSVMANEIKGLKEDPVNQILVAGIFGWPRSDSDTTRTPYKIDLIPNPNTADTGHPTVYDTWPACYDPGHMPANPNTFDPAAAGWGATPGLRLSAFIDEFTPNGLKYSICETDFQAAMSGIGKAIAKHLQNLCVNYKLWTNPDPNSPNFGKPSCRVAYRDPVIDPANPSAITYKEDPKGMPQCTDSAPVSGSVSETCWYLANDPAKCPVNGQWIRIARSADDIAQRGQDLPAGTLVNMQCRTCTDFRDQNGNPLSGC